MARELTALFGHLPANELTALHVAALTDGWRKHLSQWTQRNKVSQLRNLLRYIAKVTRSDEIHIKLPRKGARRVRIATDDERARLWAVAPPPLKFCLLCWTELGLRFIEPLRIRPSDIDEEKRTVSLITKGSKLRTLPIPQKLEELLAALGPFPNDNPIVVQIHGRETARKPETFIRRMWEKARRQGGVSTDLHIHDLRRTLATTLFRATLDPLLVQQALGHTSLETTTSYLAPHEPEKLRAQLESIRWRWKQ